MKLLQIKASWCGPCKMQTVEFNENPLDVDVEVIDIDEKSEDNVLTKYNIHSVPTLILLNDENKEIKRWIGLTKSKDINEYIRSL